MTNEQMLKELIELAEKNGYHFWNLNKKYIEFVEDEMIWQYKKGHGFYASVTDLLFDHDFAKAIFGEEDLETVYCSAGSKCEGHPKNLGWENQLKMLVVLEEEYRIKFAYENRKK